MTKLTEQLKEKIISEYFNNNKDISFIISKYKINLVVFFDIINTDYKKRQYYIKENKY